MSGTSVPRLLRIKEVEQLTGIEAWRLYEVIAAGKGPPHMRIGKTIRISETALAEWIAEQHAAPKDDPAS
jgi:excisionase family DNA binding protein